MPAPTIPRHSLLAFAVATVVFHAGAWGVVGAMGNERISVATSNDPTAGRFAMIEMKDPLMETPKPKKEPPKKSIFKPKPKPQEKVPTLPPPPMPQLPDSLRKFVNKTATPRTTGSSNPNLSAKSNQLLSSLNIGPSATAAAANNINAVTGAAPDSGGFHMGAAFLVEVLLTFIFVSVILGSTSRRAVAGFAGIPIGLTLTLVHLVGIPVTNLSVNPARSTAPAIFVGGWALAQLWLFWVAPLLGAVGAGLVSAWLHEDRAALVVTTPAAETTTTTTITPRPQPV